MTRLEAAIVYPENLEQPMEDRVIRGTRYDAARTLLAEAKARGVEDLPLLTDLTDVGGTDTGVHTFTTGDDYEVAFAKLGFVERTLP